MHHCETCKNNVCTKRVPIFSLLNHDELNKIINLINRKVYKRNEIIILEGQYLKNLVIINNGKVKAFKNTIDGKQQILYIFSSGDFFGEKSLFMNEKASYSIEALEETSICMIGKKDFQNLLSQYPNIGLKIMEELSKRIERLENAIENMGTKSVDARIYDVLLEFAKSYGTQEKEGILIDLPLSREGIANYIGLTRETVSRKLSNLQEENIIKMIGNKKILIKDKHKLF